MFRLVYVSAATAPFSTDDLLDLLSKARVKNERLGITGMLLYKDGDFLQLLEGDQQAVQTLFHTIEKDPRHTRTIVLLEEQVDQALFKDWSMGFRHLGDPEVQRTPGYSAFMNTDMTPEALAQHPSDALDLLELFRSNFGR